MLGGVRHRRVAQCGSTVLREQPSPINGCGTPAATAPSRTMSRLQSCVATDREILLRLGVDDGRNTMLRKGRCASPVSESVQGRLSSSRVIEEQNEGYHLGARNRQPRIVRSGQTAQPQNPAKYFTCFGYCAYFDWLLYYLTVSNRRAP